MFSHSSLKRSQPTSRRGFTLIELLVVIAIIAILAAILFPVFAKAREQARKSSCQSNLKQIGLGIMQYSQDNDGSYPLSFDNTWATGNTWAVRIQPYIRNVQVFGCPSDGLAMKKAPKDDQWGWAGVLTSYAANGWYSPQYDWFSDGNPNNGFRMIGIMATGGYPGWLSQNSASESSVGRPAETILAAEKYSSESLFWCQVPSAFGPNTTIAGDNYGGGWGDHKLPDGSRAPAAYPNGPNGAVSAKHMDMANFLFVDGHVKTLRPTVTNPDPANRPQDNMWDATRP